MELTKPGLLILVIVGWLAVCHCGATSTCPIVGVRVNGQTIKGTPQLLQKWSTLFLKAKKKGKDIKFSYSKRLKFKNTSYWYDKYVAKNFVPWTEDKKLKQIYVEKSKEVKFDDLPEELDVEGIYGESPKTFKGKIKNLFVRGSDKRINNSRPKNERIFVKVGTALDFTKEVLVYRPRLENNFYRYSIGYSRENQEPIFYPLQLISSCDQDYILLTLDEAGDIIQDGVALSAPLIMKDWMTRTKFADLYLKRKNQNQDLPKELFFERTDKLTGNVDRIIFEYKEDEHKREHNSYDQVKPETSKYVFKSGVAYPSIGKSITAESHVAYPSNGKSITTESHVAYPSNGKSITAESHMAYPSNGKSITAVSHVAYPSIGKSITTESHVAYPSIGKSITTDDLQPSNAFRIFTLNNDGVTLSPYDISDLSMHDTLIIQRTNQNQDFPKELILKRDNKLTGNVDRITFEYKENAKRYNSREYAEYVATSCKGVNMWLKF